LIELDSSPRLGSLYVFFDGGVGVFAFEDGRHVIATLLVLVLPQWDFGAPGMSINYSS